MTLPAKYWLEKIRQLNLREFNAANNVRIMNVCGGHERSISMAGLRGVLPNVIRLIPGPGCPVCICPEEDIYEAIQLAQLDNVILAAFGDMLRVPVNAPKNAIQSLQQAKTRGADIRPIASPMDALKIAQDNPGCSVVFFAAGFETTMAPVAALLAAGVPGNLSVLLSGRLTWPAVSMLLRSEAPGFNALIAPGHVATVMGANEWAFVAEQHLIPTAIAGFSSDSLLAAFYSVLRQLSENQPFLDNCYAQLVCADGNATAKRILRQVMKIGDANWRGIGIIPDSGFSLTKEYEIYDARKRFSNRLSASNRLRAGQMPAGCDCARVVLGKIAPNECKLYAKACTPSKPVGPCMVSDEGACRIWWSNGVHQAVDRVI